MAESNSSRQLTDLADRHFGQWTVLYRVIRPGSKKTFWLCRCKCGIERSVRSELLVAGRSRGCSPTHGLSKRPEYGAWRVMRQRCRNPNAEGYHRYGGRGIKVCDRWDDFAIFIADMGPRPSPRHSVDRYPNQNGNYEPGNCRWATKTQQQRNTRTNRLLAVNGETRCVSEWSELKGIKRPKLMYRILAGWPAERLFIP